MVYLQSRYKWREVENPLKIDDLVLLRNDHTPPCTWELGKVIAVYPGPDGVIRVVKVRTASSSYKRPITKLCRLPVENATSLS